MIRWHNERQRSVPISVSGLTVTPVSAHFGVSMSTPWFRFGVEYSRPGWIELHGGRKRRIHDFTGLARLAIAVAVMFVLRRLNDE
ncbi:MAG: hypothetical protein R3258_00270 [Acidimicrobiia bacterium]|nr:hypothetical protein [Acidimicrobiia bacterium]